MQNELSAPEQTVTQADPKEELLGQIRDCLEVIGAVCSEQEFLQFSPDFRKEFAAKVRGHAPAVLSREEATSYFLWALKELPGLIEKFRPFIRMYQAKKTKFWSIVTALNRALKSLRVLETLTQLFELAAKVQPGPHKTLIDKCLPDPEDARLVADLTEYLQNATIRLPHPGKLRAYRKLFKWVHSPEYRGTESRRDWSTVPEKSLDYLAFLDFYWQSRAWIETYYTLLLGIHEFALDLRNTRAAEDVYKVFFIPPYTRILNPKTRIEQKVPVFPDLHERFKEDAREKEKKDAKERKQHSREKKSKSIVTLPTQPR